MLHILCFVLAFSAAIGGPVPYPYDDWWFSPQSNTLDPQIFSQPESINAGDDLLYSSDLSSYSTESGKDFFNSAEKSTISDSPTLLAYTNDLNLPTTEDSMFGSDNPTAYESQGSFTDLTYPLGPVDTLASAGDNWIPTPENPCPSLQTLCCPKIQHWPIVSVEPCEQYDAAKDLNFGKCERFSIYCCSVFKGVRGNLCFNAYD